MNHDRIHSLLNAQVISVPTAPSSVVLRASCEGPVGGAAGAPDLPRAERSSRM